MQEHDLRRRLTALEDSLGAPTLNPPALSRPRGGVNRLALGVLVIATALVLAVPLIQTRSQLGAAPTLQGLWVGEGVVGGSDVGNITCMAVELDESAYAAGQTTAYWWTTGGDCRSRVSGITEQQATVEIVPVLGSVDAPSSAVRIAFTVHTTAGDEVELTVVLNAAEAESDMVRAWRTTDGADPSLGFRRVTQLSVSGPEDRGPVPEPTTLGA